MADIVPGIHPNFDITRFAPEEQRVLRRMSQIFHLNRHGELNIGHTSNYRYALIRPTPFIQGVLNTTREVMVIFSPYKDFQSRSIDAFDRLISELDEFRVEKVVRIMISYDPAVADKLSALFRAKPDAPVVIPFHLNEFGTVASNASIIGRIRDFMYSRDLFSMSSPLRSDLYFYGRSPLINEICSKLSVGENFGLFGLRRSGKTSIVHGVQRTVEARGGRGVIIDCSRPAVHRRRWNELLYLISSEVKRENKLSINISESKYNENDASDTFIHDFRVMKSQLKADFIAILFDEIEEISVDTSSSDHWRSKESTDFVNFWQSIRSGFQSVDSPFTFLIVGTNPKCLEMPAIGGLTNPLWGNVEKRFIPTFDQNLTKQMVSEIGAIMGITFEEDVMTQLYQEFGGHPFLTRYACSYVSKESMSRPLHVDRTVYRIGVDKFQSESKSYCDAIFDYLRKHYEDEYEMLQFIGNSDMHSFDELASSDIKLTEHLVGYGIVKKGIMSYYINIGIVEGYFKALARPTKLLSTSERWSELAARRGILEQKLRQTVYVFFNLNVHRNNRVNQLIECISEKRRDEISQLKFDQIFDQELCPLYFDELRQIILKKWQNFQYAFPISQADFDYHMRTINKLRSDAHAKSISDSDFDKVRVSLAEIENLA